jgi:ABC-type iron transport system FetAB permease component
MLFTRDWWKATAIRVARTAAQTLIAGVGMDYIGWLHNWLQILTLVGTMSLLSFANAIVFVPPEGK